MTLLAPGLVIAGKYVLKHKLGAGGMGSVWAARHHQLDVLVAIKFIDASCATDEADRRFEREAKACARVQSPHMVRVHDYGFEDDRPYLVMELVKGESLDDRLKKRGRLGLAETATMLTQACKGLRHAHEAGIIHRDLKPSNIFLARVHDDEIVKLLDFGIATGDAFAGALTMAGCLVGTPRYMSPEQAAQSHDLDHRSDLWSLGVVVFRCLTGRVPFRAKGIGEILQSICDGPIPVPSHVAPDLCPDVDRFFDRAFARDRTARFQSAREMADAFASIAGTASSPGTTDAPIEPEAGWRISSPPSSDSRTVPMLPPSGALVAPPLVPRPPPPPPPPEPALARTVPLDDPPRNTAAQRRIAAPVMPFIVRAPGRRPRPIWALAVLLGGALAIAVAISMAPWSAIRAVAPRTTATELLADRVPVATPRAEPEREPEREPEPRADAAPATTPTPATSSARAPVAMVAPPSSASATRSAGARRWPMPAAATTQTPKPTSAANEQHTEVSPTLGY